MLSLYSKFISKNVLVICRIKPSRHYCVPNIWGVLDGMETRRPREKIKKNFTSKKQSNFHVKLEVLGSGAKDSSRCVFLKTDSETYLFNCGEGLQKLASEYKIKLFKVPRIFVTYPSWENLSGLIGTSLTLRGGGMTELWVHGHSNIENMYSGTAKFVALRTLCVKVENCEHNQEYFDGVTRIKYVRLYPHTSPKLNQKFSDSALESPAERSISNFTEKEEWVSANDDPEHSSVVDEYSDSEELEDSDYYNYLTKHSEPGSTSVSSKKDMKRKKRSKSEACKKRKVAEEKYAISYICRTIKTSGALQLKQCIKLGVPPGPLLGKLKNGEDIELPNGRIVRSSDVTMPDIPGAVIIIVECPTEDYLDSLLREPAFCRHQSGENSLDDIASVVVHFTPSEVIEHPRYKEWTNRFHRDTKHLYINANNKAFGSIACFKQQCKINLLSPEIFPALKGNGISPSVTPDEILPERGHRIVSPESCQAVENRLYFKCENNSRIYGDRVCQVFIRPTPTYHYSKVFAPSKESILNEMFEEEGFLEEFERFKAEMVEMKSVLSKEKQYPEILFLGTGSSLPNKTRNTSGILIFVDEKKSVMFDCGEGSFLQLYNFFGPEKIDEVLRNLMVIYISHMHADHHLGLIRILKERELAFNKSGSTEYTPPFVLAPVQIIRWLDIINNDFEKIDHLFNLIPNKYIMEKHFMQEKLNQCLESADLKSIDLTLVDHCPGAFGIAITHKDGWKLTYSGDTKPCENLINLGKNSDILIHEATMDDSLAKDAKFKAHSTTTQAIEVGEKMEAKFILLTHFSQRYPHVPVISSNFSKKVGFAFDYMMISRNMLPILPKLNELFKIIFSSQLEKYEERTELHILKKKRAKERQ